MTPSKTTKMPYIDLVILDLLPDEGTMTGLQELGPSTKMLYEKLKEQGATPDMIAGRTTSLVHQGLAVRIQLFPRSAGNGFQITKKGKEALRGFNSDGKKR